MPPENKNINEKLLGLTRNLQEQLKIIDNCLKNLQQDLGSQIEDVDDYISFASRSCNKAKNLLKEISEHSGDNFIEKDPIVFIRRDRNI